MRPGVDAVGGAGLSVYDLTALQALDATGLTLGTQVYVTSLGYSYYLRGAIAPLLPGALPVLGILGTTWAPLVSMPSVAPAGVLNVGGISMPGLVQWKRGDTVTLAAAASWPNMTAWPDKSGLANNEAAVGTPTWLPNGINQRPGAVFSASNYFSSAAANLITAGTQRTVIMVIKPTNATGGRLFTFRVSGAQFICQLLNSGGFLYYADGVSTNARIIDVPVINGIPLILEFSYDASAAGAQAAVRIRINGVDHGVTAATPVSDTGGQGWATGSDIANQSLNFVGVIGETFVFSRVLSPVEKAAIENAYLAPYYTIPCALPTQVLGLGDSTTLGLGDASTQAIGGWRKAVSDLHPNLQFVGGVYAPASVAGDGTGPWNRNEGHSGFTSGPIVPPGAGQGIGGPQLVSYLTTAGTIPDLVLLQIGQNDAGLGTYTAAQTGTNVAAIVDTIYAFAPAAKVIVMRSNRRRSNQAANNVVILAQAATIAAAIAGKPNVLGPLEIPPDQPDANYIDDDHFNVAGYAANAAAWHQALVARGY